MIPLTQERWIDSLNQCKSTRFCKVYGHIKVLSDPADGFYLEKYHNSFKSDHRYHERYYYHGQIESCAVDRCEYKRFIGDKEPYKITRVIKGVEYEQGIHNDERVGYPNQDHRDVKD